MERNHIEDKVNAIVSDFRRSRNWATYINDTVRFEEFVVVRRRGGGYLATREFYKLDHILAD